ncbi:acetyl-CoA C-acyltransferase [Microbacterium sp. LMI12-1-1.1]|uniref:acetyl-CoA C-acyltransferase n=1 Tax=Microbacterium sp. LMI12-1-1.1 TaxID=3135225 RepID=UPI0034182243
MTRRWAAHDNDPVVVAYARTPIGRAFKGALREVRPEDLSLTAVQAALQAVPELDPEDIEDFFLGTALPEGVQGDNIARRVAVMAGLDGLPAAVVNRFCASSLQAARMAAHAIKAADGDVFLVGGVESVSLSSELTAVPHPDFDDAITRAERRFAEFTPWSDPRDRGEVPDVYVAMGKTAEFVAQLTGTTRADQDAFAARSQQRAITARAAGFFEREIVPVLLPDGTRVDLDDGPRPGTTVEVLAGLRPAFHPRGTVTAGNASPLNDGASAAVIMSRRRARELGITLRARILTSTASALSPEIMGLGPVAATELALARTGLSIEDLDIVELNEAFAAQVLPSAARLGIDHSRLNPHGGAIALGHPYGSTGVRMLGTLINGLETRDETIGLATLCVGGGQGMAMIVERL